MTFPFVQQVGLRGKRRGKKKTKKEITAALEKHKDLVQLDKKTPSPLTAPGGKCTFSSHRSTLVIAAEEKFSKFT